VGTPALLSGPERRREQAAGVNGRPEPEHGQATGISAAELARRVGSGDRLIDLTASDLETWLIGGGLAQVTSAGLLIPTALGIELGRALSR
jgi:hypothetical protein